MNLKTRYSSHLSILCPISVVPHITDSIQEWVERVAHIPVDESKEPPQVLSISVIFASSCLQLILTNRISIQVCIVELGGTIGDIEGMPFVEAFRQFQFRVKRENFCCAHVSLVPTVKYLHQTSLVLSVTQCAPLYNESCFSLVAPLYWRTQNEAHSVKCA